MGSRYARYRKALPFFDAVKLYGQRKAKTDGFIKLSILNHPVYLRKILSDQHMFEEIFITKDYNIPIPFTPSNIIDLGANVGYASVFFSNKFPDAKIFAIEPEENNYRIALKNTSFYKNVQLVKGAVWHKSATINVVDKGYGEAAFMIEENNVASAASVEAYTIKQIMQLMEIDKIDILKIDVEGTEKELFEHAYETWLPFVKVLIVETHDRYKKGCSKAVFSAVGKYDFSLELSGVNLVLYNNQYINPY